MQVLLQWTKCDKCPRRLRVSVGSRLHKKEIGHLLFPIEEDGKEIRCPGRMQPDGLIERATIVTPHFRRITRRRSAA